MKNRIRKKMVIMDKKEKDMEIWSEYEAYLAEHKHNVLQAYQWMIDHKIVYLKNMSSSEIEKLHKQILTHDSSKNDLVEFWPYANYFYSDVVTDDIKEKFNEAWLRHIHKNGHHWQHWVLICDDEEEGIITLKIPFNYIIEMICDWWSFSWKKGYLYEIFEWYKEHRDYMKIESSSRVIIENILSDIHKKLESECGNTVDKEG